MDIAILVIGIILWIVGQVKLSNGDQSGKTLRLIGIIATCAIVIWLIICFAVGVGIGLGMA